MKIVTKIEKFRGKKGYRKIVFDDSSKIEVDVEILAYFHIKEGVQFDEIELNKIKGIASRKLAKEEILEFLKHKSRSESEIRKKLSGTKVNDEIIDEIIDDLKRVGFINDTDFALRFCRNFINRKPAGEILLKIELRKRGISTEIIDETIDKIYTEFDKKELARKLIHKKKFNPSTKDKKIKKKIADLLLRRGFDWGIVWEVMKVNTVD